MTGEKIIFEVQDNIATITLNNPKYLNPIDEELADELSKSISICATKEDIRAVILTGAGKNFCSGVDIKTLQRDSDSARSIIRKTALPTLRIRDLRKPVIASIRGAAAASGFNLALACDFRVCTEEAKFIQNFANIGLVNDMGGIYLLTQMLGAAKATELLMTGRTVYAQEAKELNLVNQVVSSEQLEMSTWELATELASGPTKALGGMKALINRCKFKEFDEIIDEEYKFQTDCVKSEDSKEGLTAFLEKRKPNFIGK